MSPFFKYVAANSEIGGIVNNDCRVCRIVGFVGFVGFVGGESLFLVLDLLEAIKLVSSSRVRYRARSRLATHDVSVVSVVSQSPPESRQNDVFERRAQSAFTR